jgi:hypothetical protein
VGGATLGAVAAALAEGVRAMSLTGKEVSIIARVGSALAAFSDIGRGGLRLPIHHRQVNERWLDQFRPWVYGAGFGWQIGTGLATYIVTAAVYLMILLSALIGNPWAAIALGVLFGLVRGLSVCLGRRITNSETLRTFHLHFQQLGPTVRRATVALELAVVVVFAGTLSPWIALGLMVGAGAWSLRWVRWRQAGKLGGRDDVPRRQLRPRPAE